jgi:hypothetical protein
MVPNGVAPAPSKRSLQKLSGASDGGGSARARASVCIRRWNDGASLYPPMRYASGPCRANRTGNPPNDWCSLTVRAHSHAPA